MLAFVGLVTVVSVLALITTRRMTALVALIIVPVVAALAVGVGAQTSAFVVAGIQQTAPVAAMFLFAILYFGVMTDAGMLDPIVDRILGAVGTRPTRIVMGTALLALLVHLDGSGAVTFLVTIPAMLPLYERLRMDKRVLACVASLAAGVNFLPWTGPVLRAATALHVSTTDLFRPLVPVQLVGLVFVGSAAFVLGRREERRLGLRRSNDEAPPPARELSIEQRSLRRPHLFWANVLLTLIIMIVMVSGVVDPSLMFMGGTAVALVLNYRDSDAQRARVDAHARAAVMMAAILLAAGAFTGIMKGAGMLSAMADAAVRVIPPSMARHLPVALGLVSMPLSLLFDPDSFYLGALPVVAQVASTLGVPPLQVGQAALLGQMTTGFPVSPLTPASFLVAGLSGVDFGEHQRFATPYLFAASILMTIACVLFGIFPL